MFDYKKITLGYAPTRRFDFPDPKNAYQNSLKIKEKVFSILKKMNNVEIVDLSFLNEEGLLYQACDVEKVAKRFRNAGVDALFMPHANFGCEEVVIKLCRALRVPVLLWGPRDEAPPGGFCYRQTDTQCGLFASTMGLLREEIPFSYIENCWLDSPVLETELEKFIRAIGAVRAFKHMTIGQIGPRPRDFLSVIADESELVNKCGIDIVPVDGTEFVSEFNRILEKCGDEIDALVAETKNSFACYTITDKKARYNAATELTIRNIAEQYGCTVMAADCWYIKLLLDRTNPCFSFGNLAEKGLPVACETDVYGAITQGLLAGVARGETPSFIADLTIRHPTNDNAELLWHCGPFPKSLAKPECNPELTNDCMGRYEIKGGDITVARFGGLKGKFSLFCGEGKGVDGPVTGGNYVWLEVDDWAKWERKLMYGPYIHHICGIHGKYQAALEEACRFLPIQGDFMTR